MGRLWSTGRVPDVVKRFASKIKVPSVRDLVKLLTNSWRKSRASWAVSCDADELVECDCWPWMRGKAVVDSPGSFVAAERSEVK